MASASFRSTEKGKRGGEDSKLHQHVLYQGNSRSSTSLCLDLFYDVGIRGVSNKDKFATVLKSDLDARMYRIAYLVKPTTLSKHCRK